MRTLALCFLTLLFCGSAAAEPFPEMELGIGMYRIETEVAVSEEMREQGLMFREKMPANHGMLFVFPAPAQVCMWMKNTLLPLSVAFLDDQGAIVNIEEMQADTTTNHCPIAPIRYALEMNKQWFAERVIVPGMVVSGLPKK